MGPNLEHHPFPHHDPHEAASYSFCRQPKNKNIIISFMALSNHSWCGPSVGIVPSISLQLLAQDCHQIEGIVTRGQQRKSLCKHNWVF
jgi:hypothetical protein